METNKRYKCECGMIYGDVWDAEQCCKPAIEEIDIFICEECKEEYETQQEAFNCCNQTGINQFGTSEKDTNVKQKEVEK